MPSALAGTDSLPSGELAPHAAIPQHSPGPGSSGARHRAHRDHPASHARAGQRPCWGPRATQSCLASPAKLAPAASGGGDQGTRVKARMFWRRRWHVF